MSNLNYHKEQFIKAAKLIPGFSATIRSMQAGYQGFSLDPEMADELTKFIGLSDRALAIGAAKEGVILTNFENNLGNLTDEEVAKYMKEKFNKTPEEIGAIYRRLYNDIQANKGASGTVIKGVNKASKLMGDIGSRLRSLFKDTLGRFG